MKSSDLILFGKEKMAKEKCGYDNKGFVVTEKNIWMTKVSWIKEQAE